MELREGRDWQLFLTTAIENANDAVLLLRFEGARGPFIIEYVNRAFTEQTGYSPSEAVGRSVELVYGEQTDRAVVRHLLDELAAGRSASGELRKYRKDGSSFWCELNIRPLRDEQGAVTGAVTIQRDITARKQREEQLAQTRDLLDAIMANTKSVVYAKDLEGKYLLVNSEYERLHGLTSEHIVGKTDFDFFSAQTAEQFRANDRRALYSEVPLSIEERVPTEDGGSRIFLSVKFALTDSTGRPYATCGMSTDITERAESLQELRLLRLALDCARDAIAIFRLHEDGTWRIYYANAEMSRMTGYTSEELVGSTSDFFIGDATDADAIARSREELKAGKHVYAEWYAYRKDGSTFWIELNASPLGQDDGMYTIVVYRDITKKKEQEEQLSYEASHDELTGVFNRRYLDRALERAIWDAHSRQAEHGLIVLDLDGFKAINDTYGHEAGDKLLVALGILMSSRLRRGDILARLGGDEFAIILLGCSAEQSMRLGSEILEAISNYAYPLGEHRLRVSASAGVAVIDSDTTDARTVLRTADLACYGAKRAGKNRILIQDRATTQGGE